MGGDSGGAVKLDVAIGIFEQDHQKFSLADREKIFQVAVDINLDEEDFTPLHTYIFDTNWRDFRGFTEVEKQVFSQTPYFNEDQDKQGTIRIHPTMIIAKKSFTGSIDRGIKPYPFLRHHYELGRWIDKDGSSEGRFLKVPEVLCKKLFIRVPVGSECECGERHFKV